MKPTHTPFLVAALAALVGASACSLVASNEGEGEGEGEGEPTTRGCAADAIEGRFGTSTGIVACSGRWKEPGLHLNKSTEPNRRDGEFATAADLCAAEWHICQSVTEVDEELDGQPCSPSLPGFFASQQATVGNSTCTADGFGAHDVAGCADAASQANTFQSENCGAMKRLVGNNCLAGWACGNSRAESLELVHSGADGGVLCCQDDVSGQGCGAISIITLNANADAGLDLLNPSVSRGNREAMVVQRAAFESLTRFTDDRLADAAIIHAELTVPVTIGTGSVEISTTTSTWTEFRDDCRVVVGTDTELGCDGTADGVSWAGPDPSTVDSASQAPWPGGPTGGGPPLRAALATAIVTSAGAVANVDTMAAMFSGIEGGDVNPLRLTLRLRGLEETRELTLGTREAGLPATLTLQRCVNR